VCLAQGASAELLALQDAATTAGLSFYLATAPQQLSALVTAQDELIVLADGLFADPEAVAPLIEGARAVVLVQPEEGAVAAGFERLDAAYAAGGVVKVPGALVERLHDLPPDCDAGSALTRIALQAGAQRRPVPAAARAGVGWCLVRDEAEALAVEVAWLRERLVPDRDAAPTQRIARVGVLALGPSLLHAGNASGLMALAALAGLLLSNGLGWFGLTVPALVLAALTSLLVKAAGMLRGAERQAHGVLPPAVARVDVLGWMLDLTLVAIVALGLGAAAGEAPVALDHRIFDPLVLLLLLHLVPRLLPGRLATWIGDRGVLALCLAAAAGFGHLGVAVRLLAVATAICGIVFPRRRLN